MTILNIDRLAGMDERPNAPADTAHSIRGMRFDATEGRWVSDRGYASYFPSAPSRGASGATYSMAIHQTQNGATKDIIVERDDGTGNTGLYRVTPHQTSGVIAIQTGRHTPGANEPGTCFSSFGQVLIAINGWDQPMRIYPSTSGTVRAEHFGFTQIPAPCIPIELAEGASLGTAGDYRYSVSQTTDVTTGYPVRNTIGMGSITANEPNSYRYRYSWVTDTGSESPLSAESSVLTWPTGAAGYRYGAIIIGILPGPPGTVKRRLYRTKNMGATSLTADATYFYVADIPNNFEDAFTDHRPDGLLVSEAPGLINSAPMPSDTRWSVPYAGRLWIVAGDYRVHWSQAGQCESFGAADFVDVSGRAGGRVTGLLPYNDMLLILRESAIEAVIAQNDTYRAVTILQGVGTHAPHAAITSSDYGAIIVADDGIYAIQGSYTGGGRVSVVELTANISWDRVSIASLARAWSWLNPRDREIVFALPTDGMTYPTMELVLHLDAGRDATSPAWSQRFNVQAACGVAGPEGWPYIGDHGQNLATTDQLPLFLGVWAAYNSYGYNDSDATYATFLERPEAWWETTDLQLGDPDKCKTVRYVTATVSLYGDNPIYLDAYLDGGWEQQGTIQTSPTQVLDRKVVSVLGTAVQGTDKFDKRIVTQIRFDLSLFHTRRIRFRFRSASVWAIYGYSVHFEESNPNLPFSPVQRATTFSGAPTVNIPVARLPGGIK